MQHDLATDALDYALPPELIATRPADPRDSARMLVVHCHDDRIEHARVQDLGDFVEASDTLVFNTSAVMPARFLGRRAGTGGRLEGLFVETLDDGRWLVMLKCNRRPRAGDTIELLDRDRRPTRHQLRLDETHPDGWIATPTDVAETMLDEVGLTPLPPYIRRARDGELVDDALDRAWYQTVYAEASQRCSVAAPTAGLHFTGELLARLRASGVGRIDVTLHVGPGTFRPITALSLADHVMHSEQYEVSEEALAALRARRGGGRVIAVGTTTVRTLESLPDPLPRASVRGRTDLLIAPPYEFKHIDGMLTNFHLPRSTLLALVAAQIGLERLKSVYAEAIRHRYRFYSYGDAMLVLP